MRIVPDSMTAAWHNQAKIGDQRPVVRAIIQKQNLIKFDYDTAWVQGGSFDEDRHRTGHFNSFIFGDTSPFREIRNIQSCSWERSVGQDAATCTLTLLNSELSAIGEGRTNPSSPDEFDKPGYFTYNRGDQAVDANRWGYDDQTGWNGVFMPDMVVKTYEGYGCDRTVNPTQDPNLVQSGVWMIDKVTYGADGTMSLEMRDLARLLLDEIVFPPAVPLAEYPLSWVRNHTENIDHRDALGGDWKDGLRSIGTATSSNDFYIDHHALTNAPYAKYVSASGGVDGHHAGHALYKHDPDGSDNDLFWRSTGQDSRNSFVWWEFDVDNGTVPVAALRLSMAGGPYRVYISIHDGTDWVGHKKIHWKRNGESGSPGNVNIHADIPFVASKIADRFYPFDVILPRKYNAKKIRLTFTMLTHSAVGEHPFRAGFRELQIYTGNYDDLHFDQGKVLKVVGNYGDWTDVVKWVCAWAGWFWPPHSTDLDFIRVQHSHEGDRDYITYTYPDPVLPKGRVWGDFMKSGTGGIADLTVDQFDKKPLMDIINYIRDLLGFLFFIDETGGVVWRLPNIGMGGTPKLGNYVSPEKMDSIPGKPGKRGRHGRTDEIVVLDENTNLLSYSTALNSTNLRDRIFVANAVGGIGVVIKGFNPNPVGLRRVAGWSDQHFATKQEARVMADMIGVQQMFSYRTGQAVIPGYPKIQVDDMVRIYERVTNETFYHYVMGIKSELDMESGEWTYTLDTHWLGERPSDAWVVRVDELENVTQNYLKAIGYDPKDSADNDEKPPGGS